MPLAMLMLVAVILTAVWVTVQANRYRQDVFHHWYSIGVRDATYNTPQFSIADTKSQFIANAYWAGYNDEKVKHQWTP